VSPGQSIWLVEIGLKPWMASRREALGLDVPAVVAFEEVIAAACDAGAARALAEGQFATRAHHEPVLRRRLHSLRLTAVDCAAVDAVRLDD
jgi:hypothetical protein